jgi:hypothetical protein
MYQEILKQGRVSVEDVPPAGIVDIYPEEPKKGSDFTRYYATRGPFTDTNTDAYSSFTNVPSGYTAVGAAGAVAVIGALAVWNRRSTGQPGTNQPNRSYLPISKREQRGLGLLP